MNVHSLELDNDLSGLPGQITHVPVAVKVGNQPVEEKMEKSGLGLMYSLVGVQKYKWPT